MGHFVLILCASTRATLCVLCTVDVVEQHSSCSCTYLACDVEAGGSGFASAY